MKHTSKIVFIFLSVLSPKIYVNTTTATQIASNVLNSKVFPNPTFSNFENTISFSLENESNIRLELLNEKGEILQNLANGIHVTGNYQYPFTLKSKYIKGLETIYYRLTIGDQSETKRIVIE